MERLLNLLLFWYFHTFLLTIHVWIVVSPQKLSLIIYLINTDMSKCQMWLQVMERPLILLRFLVIFIHYYWRVFMTKVLYLYQTFTDCVSNQCWYVKMPDVTASYGMPLNFITAFLQKFLKFVTQLFLIQ